MEHVVSGPLFLTRGVFESVIAVAVLCMLYKIRCNSMHSFYGALSVLSVSGQVTCGALVAHQYTYTSSLQILPVPQGLYFVI